MERLVWGYGDGSTLPVYDTPIGRLGSVICWENYMPLLRMVMYSKNIELDCTPTADDSDTWQISIRHIALEGRCFALSACQYVTRDAFTEDYDPIRTYWPSLPDGALLPTYSGIRPKLTGQGEAAADFMIQGPTEHGVAGLWNLYGIESPSLTAALALAEVVVLRL